MQQIKIFKGIENDTLALEREVNTWLKNHSVKVLNVFGNLAPQSYQGGGTPSILGAERTAGKAFAASDVMLVVVYETAT